MSASGPSDILTRDEWKCKMSMQPAKSSWIRKAGAKKSRASFPELFFDLVFVFGLIQLSHTLAADFTSATVGEAFLLILAIWWLWINTTWVTNLLDTDQESVRYMLFALMSAGILMAIALPKAFGEHALTFAAIYAISQIGRSAFTWFAFRHQNQQSAATFLRITIWSVVTGILWVGGAVANLEWRMIIWSAAIVLEYAVPLFQFRVPGFGSAAKDTLNLSGEHLAERCALFVIICLGETILTTGRNVAEHMQSGLTFVVFCSAFLSTVAMWWIYFHQGQEEVAEKAEETAAPEAVAHNLFTYGHLPIVTGIVLTAVGQDLSLSHADEAGSLRNAVAILGGPFLFLNGIIWIKLSASRRFPLSHVAGLLALALSIGVVAVAPLYVLNILATASLLLTAIWEYRALRTSATGAA